MCVQSSTEVPHDELTLAVADLGFLEGGFRFRKITVRACVVMAEALLALIRQNVVQALCKPFSKNQIQMKHSTSKLILYLFTLLQYHALHTQCDVNVNANLMSVPTWVPPIVCRILCNLLLWQLTIDLIPLHLNVLRIAVLISICSTMGITDINCCIESTELIHKINMKLEFTSVSAF